MLGKFAPKITAFLGGLKRVKGDITFSLFTATIGKIKGTAISGTTGTGNVVLSASPTLTGTPTVPTAAAATGGTQIASQAYADTSSANAAAAANAGLQVDYTTAAKLPNSPIYANGVAGIGATITTLTTNTTLVVDGQNVALNQQFLAKNEGDSGGLGALANGIYKLTTAPSVGVAWIATRVIDYDQPSDINYVGAIYTTSGTANAGISFALTTKVTTVGVDPLTYTTAIAAYSNTALINGTNNFTGVNSFVNSTEGYTTTATAAGTTTLTVSSNQQQYFTGSTTQTCQLPVTSTLVLGQSYYIENDSSGAVTVNSSGGNAVIILAGGTSALVKCILTSGTGAASWSVLYFGFSITTAKKLSVSNSLTLIGTDGTSITFPSTSCIVARTDAANTFTGTQTIATIALTGGNIDGTTIGSTTPAAAQVYQAANAQTGTSYTHVIGDTDKMLTLNNAGAITFTLDTNANVATPVNAKIDLLQLGAGQVTVVGAGGVTLQSYSSKTKLAGQYAFGTVFKQATNTWVLGGNLA